MKNRSRLVRSPAPRLKHKLNFVFHFSFQSSVERTLTQPLKCLEDTHCMKKKFFSEGIRFECQGSGKCCVSRGGYGFVYMSLEDRRRMARVLGIPTGVFTRKYCEKTNGWFHLKETGDDCRFLKGNQCTVYEGRPTQCRTWPFWPENLNARAWTQEVVRFCPGVGKGRLYTAQEIARIAKMDEWKES
jgi:uncharacterized protein